MRVASAARAVAGELGIDLPAPEPARVSADSAPEAPSFGERLVTSLFADVRGYTTLTAESSPQELTERMTSLYRFARTEVERHFGIVDKFAGDAVMATFNVSGSRIDHCVQALQAALALRDKAALLDLQLGIGIAVGPAVLGPGLRTPTSRYAASRPTSRLGSRRRPRAARSCSARRRSGASRTGSRSAAWQPGASRWS